MDYAAMGQRIKAKRKELHLTQEQLAEVCGLSTSFLGHIERGTRKASLETFYALCEALHVSADYLTGLEAARAVNDVFDGLQTIPAEQVIESLKRLKPYVNRL